MCSFNALYLPLSLSSPPPRSGCFWKETFPPAVTHTASSHSPLLFSTFSVREVDAVASESPACCSVVLGGRTDSLNSSSVSKLVSPNAAVLCLVLHYAGRTATISLSPMSICPVSHSPVLFPSPIPWLQVGVGKIH